jgi:hypothetical protein
MKVILGSDFYFYFYDENLPFCFVEKNKSKATWSKKLFGNFPKELSHCKEESYENC